MSETLPTQEALRSTAAIPQPLYQDAPLDPACRATTTAHAIPSGGVNLNAVLYSAAGAGPHPAALLLHGLPGNEQNIDLAQSMRRAGWSVLTIHYRGSWGGPGDFSFEHCLEDAHAAIGWMREASAHRLDPARMIVIGHSMGGFVAVATLAKDPDLLGGVTISAVDLGRSFGQSSRDDAADRVDENVGAGAGLHILAGTSPERLAAEARVNAGRWRLTNYADRLTTRALMLVTSNDGFAEGSFALSETIRQARRGQLTQRHFETDHSYSDSRIGLQVEILRWLDLVAAGR